MRVNADQSIDVQYEDGEIDLELSPACVRKFENEASMGPYDHTFFVGEEVLCNFKGGTKMMKGRIVSKNKYDNTYSVEYDNAYTENEVASGRLRLADPKSDRGRIASVVGLSVGDRVEVNVRRRGKWFKGRIDIDRLEPCPVAVTDLPCGEGLS